MRIGQVKRLAMLAPVDFSIGAKLLLHFIAEEIPALQVTGAELALRVFFVSRPHAWNTPLNLSAVAERIHQFRDRYRLFAGGILGIRHK